MTTDIKNETPKPVGSGDFVRRPAPTYDEHRDWVVTSIASKVRIEIDHWAEMWKDPLQHQEELVRLITYALAGRYPPPLACEACKGRGKISVGTPWAGEPECPVCSSPNIVHEPHRGSPSPTE